MKTTSIAIILTVGLTLAGCATMPKIYDVQSDRTFNASFDDTWDAVIEYFAENNIPIRTIEKDSGVIYAEQMFATGYDVSFLDYADCGGLALADSRRAQFNVLVREASDVTTRVRVTTEFVEARRDFWGQSISVVCNSTGAMEDAVLTSVQIRLE